MKYMTFNSSCSYAGLANMLSQYGHDVEDRQIALAMELPYLFAFEDGQYRSGPMLQGKPWFDLYLRPRGFTLQEEVVSRDQLPELLASRGPAMLGLLISERSKHAVIFTGIERGNYKFINNRHPLADEPDEFILTREELLARTDQQVHVAALLPIPAVPLNLSPLLEQSLLVLDAYRRDLQSLRQEPCSASDLRTLMNTHFRAFLLDALTMMQLIHENALAARLTALQTALLQAVKSDASGTLDQLLPMDDLMLALTDYSTVISNRIAQL